MKALEALFRRRRFVIDSRFQLSVLWRVLAVSLFVQLAVLVGLAIPLVRNVCSDQGDEVLKIDAAVVLLHLHDNVWWILLVSLVLPALVVIQITHRIAGPLLRVRRHLETLGRGRLPGALTLRSKDYLVAEVALLQETTTRLARQVDEMRGDHAKLVATLSRAREDADHDPAVRSSLAAATAVVEELGARLARFLPPRDAPQEQVRDDGPPSQTGRASAETTRTGRPIGAGRDG